MKYLFRLYDLSENETKLYSVEAEDETEAGNILAKSFMPQIPRICFGPFVKALATVNVTVLSLGPLDSIEEIK